ncbi:NADPH-dependent 2,4-dienoyl-CoA reductase/sulfur reductase-like enzyme [Streptomyces sp. SAI-135]|uniref:NAD(P)/FAD-dependent oxidoreductase n=1 Tax=unclassified Streptomyces TaxID=2593676 RepID=UPI0024768B44|nr:MULTISPECIES: FAD-dependent oxidoreductase [unclassified Streptomyces]MDH6520731.1 NADPH-dependent 2,4-dienoyl-CoA reductase/sulfur reductase-like enzyme [Streptomyces sp. SAI-090]MDH6572035.1 NADPH-dependent 2,4-dienoyl-CoA reductase/sulfur reductase-like enzyme [Streptomyces sp. SAI-117]MDH6615177.1 NADPH-dependent 2,4-dienoyl-CoA reductase/sulfur reductase-like enzyme [Streptomyces sp. SAI-135]
MRMVAVVGASLAGLSAARSLRGQGFDGRLVVIGDELHRPYDRPPLSKEFLAGSLAETELALEPDDEDLRAEWLLGVRAVGLDGPQRAVRLADGSEVRADGVVIATGAAARTLPGTDGLAGVHTLRTLDDARALRDELALGGRLVVIGGGFIGAEVASTAYALGLDVTVVEAAPTPLAGPLGETMGGIVSALHADHGVRLLCGVGVQGLRGVSRVEAVLLEDGRSIPADTVVVGVGARPCVEWLAGSGLELADGVRCGADGRTGLPGVVAVGDCASWYDPRAGLHRRVEHWTGARERPDAAVTALLAGGAVEPGAPRPPYFWSDQYGVKIQFAGHAAAADSVTIEEGARDDRNVLAVYRRSGHPVAVLGMNQPRLFTRWRKQLAAAA